MGSANGLGHIEKMKCCRNSSPVLLNNCQDHDITVAFDSAGSIRCPNDMQVMRGMYRSGNSVGNTIEHLDKIVCCDLHVTSPGPTTIRSYSSVYQNQPWGTGLARSSLNSPQAWVAQSVSSGSEWMIINAGKPVRMSGVITMGRADSHMWVKEFRVYTSMDGETWGAYTICPGNTDVSSQARCMLDERDAQYLKIVPYTWVGGSAWTARKP